MKPSGGAVTIGKLSIVIGAIYILRIPLIMVVLGGGGGVLAPFLRFLHIIVGNLHWGDNIGALKAVYVDLPLAAVVIASGILTLKGRRLGLVLAYVFAGLTIALEAFGLMNITLPRLRFTSVEPAIMAAAIVSFLGKLIYPILLLFFHSLPQARRQI